MRVASLHMTNRYLKQLNRSYESQTKLMEQGDGDKIHRPSDNPIWYSKYLRYSNGKGQNNQYQTNVSTAISWMRNTDATLVDMSDQLKTLVVKTNQAQDTMTNEDMKLLSREMKVLVDQVVSDANSNVNGRYLFSGQKDLVQPYVMSSDKVDRGLTKTLDDNQMSFFNDANLSGDIRQMLVLQGDDGQEYYLNTLTGNVYDKEFMDEGYKQRMIAGQEHVQFSDAVGSISFTNVGAYFDEYGVIAPQSKDVYHWSITPPGSGSAVRLKLGYINQYIVKYYGDKKHWSMVREEGKTYSEHAKAKVTDIVNANGQDIAGFTIFDDENCGRQLLGVSPVSGAAAFNDALTIVAKADEGNCARWMSSDGKTLANNCFNIVNLAQARIASRQQSYQDCQNMLTTQDETITQDITEVHNADIAKLSVDLMQAQTVYNLSLSIGARIIPPSLADYLQ